ncbi:MAG: hypothetical protein E7161_05415 [Firmicutes bacterium]|nr:hypothetical protein [Bacillota bacterium]
MGLFRDITIKRIIKKIKENKKFFLPSFISEKDLLYKDENGITFFEHILRNEVAYDYIFSHLEIPKNNPDIIFLLAKHRKLKEHLSLCFLLEEDNLFVKYNDKFLLHYILPNIDIKSFCQILSDIVANYEIIDFLIERCLLNLICYVNPKIVQNIVKVNNEGYALIEKYINNDYVFIELMKLVEDKKKVYEICKRYNKIDVLNLIFEKEFTRIVKDNQPSDYLERSYFEKEEKLLVDIESKQIIDEFIKLFEEELDREQLEFLRYSFTKAIESESEKAKILLNNLISIKREYPKEYKYTFDSKKISCHNKGTINFAAYEQLPVVLFHELGHLIHQFYEQQNVSVSILNEIIKTRNNPEILRGDSFEEFKKLYKKIEAEAYEEGKQYYQKHFNLIASNFEEYLKQLNLPDDVVEKIKSISNYEVRLLKKQEQIICEQYKKQYLLLKYPQLSQLSDILDAILAGNIKCFDHMHGHSVDYYSNIKNCFSEIVACFVSLTFLPDSKHYLGMLKNIIGEKLFYDIEQYCNNIINGKKINAGKTL